MLVVTGVVFGEIVFAKGELLITVASGSGDIAEA
jgi:hypothetical protein